MLGTTSAEMQKWFDQNHTSRSTKPISASQRRVDARLHLPEEILLRQVGRLLLGRRGSAGLRRLRLHGVLRGARRRRLAPPRPCAGQSGAPAARSGNRRQRAPPWRRQAGPDDWRRRPRAARARRAARRADRTRLRRSSRPADPARSDARPARLQLLDRASSGSPVCRTIEPHWGRRTEIIGDGREAISLRKNTDNGNGLRDKQACIFVSIQPRYSRSFAGGGH